MTDRTQPEIGCSRVHSRKSARREMAAAVNKHLELAGLCSRELSACSRVIESVKLLISRASGDTALRNVQLSDAVHHAELRACQENFEVGLRANHFPANRLAQA